MIIVKTRTEHNCITCSAVIKKGSKALIEYFDARTFAGRYYYCTKCGIKVVSLLKSELQKEKK